jgi:hypothetical protein
MPKIDYTAIALDEQWRQRVVSEKQALKEWPANWGMLAHDWDPEKNDPTTAAGPSTTTTTTTTTTTNNNNGSSAAAPVKKYRGLAADMGGKVVPFGPASEEWKQRKLELKEMVPREKYDYPRTRAQEVGWHAGDIKKIERFGVNAYNHRRIPFE